MEGIILAAGKGSRLRPLTLTVPKPLIPVAGKPLVQYGIEQLKEVGVERTVLVVGWLGDLFRETLGDGSALGMRFEYVRQPKRLGVAHAIHTAIVEADVNSPFLVYFGDNVFDDEWIKKFETIDYEFDAFVVLAKVDDPRRFGVPVIKSGKIVKFVEKPEEPPSSYALTGLYVFRDPDQYEGCFSELRPSWRGEYEITDLLNCYIKRGYEVRYAVVEGWWKDTGVPEDLIEAMKFILEKKLVPKVEGAVEGEVVGKVYVAEGATVEGKLVGPAYVGPRAVVRGSAGPFVDVEEGSTVEGSFMESLIFKGSKVLMIEGAALKRSVVGDHSNIKVNAPVVLEDALFASKSSLKVGRLG